MQMLFHFKNVHDNVNKHKLGKNIIKQVKQFGCERFHSIISKTDFSMCLFHPHCSYNDHVNVFIFFFSLSSFSLCYAVSNYIIDDCDREFNVLCFCLVLNDSYYFLFFYLSFFIQNSICYKNKFEQLKEIEIEAKTYKLHVFRKRKKKLKVKKESMKCYR